MAYCDAVNCPRSVEELTDENSMDVHPRAETPTMASRFTEVTIGEQIWRIHKTCFDPRRHQRA